MAPNFFKHFFFFEVVWKSSWTKYTFTPVNNIFNLVTVSFKTVLLSMSQKHHASLLLHVQAFCENHQADFISDSNHVRNLFGDKFHSQVDKSFFFFRSIFLHFASDWTFIIFNWQLACHWSLMKSFKGHSSKFAKFWCRCWCGFLNLLVIVKIAELFKQCYKTLCNNWTAQVAWVLLVYWLPMSVTRTCISVKQ